MSNITFHDLRKKINLYDDLKEDNKKLQEGPEYQIAAPLILGGAAIAGGAMVGNQLARWGARKLFPNSKFAQGKTSIDRPFSGRLTGIPNPFNMSTPNIEKSGKGTRSWAPDDDDNIRKVGDFKLSASDNLTHPEWSEKMSDQAKLGASAAQQMHVERMNHERTTHMGSYDALHAHDAAVKNHYSQNLDPKDEPKLTDYTGPTGPTSEARKAFELHKNMGPGSVKSGEFETQLRNMHRLDTGNETHKPFKSALPQEVQDQAKQFNSELKTRSFGSGEWIRKHTGLRDLGKLAAHLASQYLPIHGFARYIRGRR